MSATATTGPEDAHLRSRPVSFSVPGVEDNSPIPVGEAAVGAEGAGPPHLWDRRTEHPAKENYF